MLPRTVLFLLAFTVRVACSMPRVSGTDDADGISPYHTLISNCGVQFIRVWSLPALLLLSEPWSVGRSAARGTRPRRGSDPSPPAQAPESPYFLPRFETELGEDAENFTRARGLRVRRQQRPVDEVASLSALIEGK